MNKLLYIYSEHIEDYFRRLGGQGRYDGYREFHPSVMMLCLLLDLNIPLYTHPSMLNETNRLPVEVKKKLDKLEIDRKSFEDFIHTVKSYLSKIRGDDLKRFEMFIDENKLKYEEYLNKLN